MTAVAAKYNELKKLNVEVLSMSVNSPFAHKMWQEIELVKMIDGGVPYPMLSDPGGKIGTAYGVYDEDRGVNLRGRFIIDPDGIIQAYEILTSAVGRNVSELLRQIHAFQLVRKTYGAEVTPSGWQPGKPTIRPNNNLIGKVWTVWKP